MTTNTQFKEQKKKRTERNELMKKKKKNKKRTNVNDIHLLNISTSYAFTIKLVETMNRTITNNQHEMKKTK